MVCGEAIPLQDGFHAATAVATQEKASSGPLVDRCVRGLREQYR